MGFEFCFDGGGSDTMEVDREKVRDVMNEFLEFVKVKDVDLEKGVVRFEGIVGDDIVYDVESEVGKVNGFLSTLSSVVKGELKIDGDMVRDELEKVKFLYGVLGEKVFDFLGGRFYSYTIQDLLQRDDEFCFKIVRKVFEKGIIKTDEVMNDIALGIVDYGIEETIIEGLSKLGLIDELVKHLWLRIKRKKEYNEKFTVEIVVRILESVKLILKYNPKNKEDLEKIRLFVRNWLIGNKRFVNKLYDDYKKRFVMVCKMYRDVFGEDKTIDGYILTLSL